MAPGPTDILVGASADDHEDISENVGMRLEAIGATATSRSQISEEQHTVTGDADTTLNSSGDVGEGGAPEKLDEISTQMKAVDLYVSKKSEGALMLQLIGPQSYSAHVSAHVYWDGRRSDDTWLYLDGWKGGFVESSHASHDLYRRKRFFKRSRHEDIQNMDEDYILLDVESDPKYENVNPGTVTVEGFGMECWDYELEFGKKRSETILVSYGDLPNVPARKLLRRIDELRHGGTMLGWDREGEKADLKEFFGIMLTEAYRTDGSRWDVSWLLGDFYRLLNRQDIFADFRSQSSIAMAWGGSKEESIGIWNFLWQIILAKELALRLERFQDASHSGFTHRVLASLIIQDLWFNNVEVVLTDAIILLDGAKKPETPEERATAETFKSKGNQAMKNQKWRDAIDFYTEAIKVDPTNAIYYANRSAAFLSIEKHDEACNDAYVATQLDPKYAKAWARLGLAERKIGRGKRARDAYQHAIQLAGNDATSLMKQGLADAEAKIKADIDAIGKETDTAAKEMLRRNYLDEDWDINHKVTELHSHVHERQVEGLLLFAERMKWPYINEVRGFAEDVYGNLRGGQNISNHLHDWLFGMMLPGKWMSFKIMAALVLCTPSISAHLGFAHYYDCGLSLPKQSYWRIRTVLGRVLGCLPGLVSQCGWIGPCPPVAFIPPLLEETKKEPRYIHLKARHVAPMEYTPSSDDGVIYLGGRHSRYEAIHIRPDEDLQSYITEIRDANNWVIPEPPVRELSTCTIQSIRLKKLPLDAKIAAQRAKKEISDKDVDQQTDYRASIIFTMDNNEDPITYTLYTNPVFITLPPCHPGPKVLHEVHLRELPKYQKNIYTVDRLKDLTPEDLDDDVMVINATGKGAEALARAWCSERGKNAVARRAGGPCFVCALRAASKAAHLADCAQRTNLR